MRISATCAPISSWIFCAGCLAADGYTLKGVMNITDVGHLMSDADDGEDKMAKAAAEQKKTPEEVAAFYTGVFMKDIAALNIGRPEINRQGHRQH